MSVIRHLSISMSKSCHEDGGSKGKSLAAADRRVVEGLDLRNLRRRNPRTNAVRRRRQPAVHRGASRCSAARSPIYNGSFNSPLLMRTFHPCFNAFAKSSGRFSQRLFVSAGGARCPVCGNQLQIRLNADEMGVRCVRCGASPVTQSIVDVIRAEYPDLSALSAYELSSRGALVEWLAPRAGSASPYSLARFDKWIPCGIKLPWASAAVG
jgi:Zn ribbon nucleic-acid-binding protein